MGDYSQMFQDDPELLNRALLSFDQAHPEAARPAPVQAEPPVTTEPVGRVDMTVERPVERPTGSLGQQQRQLTNERVDSANQTADSYQREGDAKADASARAAQIYAQQAAVADRYSAAAERRYNDDQERADHYRRMVDEDFERLRQEPPKPGRMKNAFNVITGIIGAAAGGTTGDALQMLRAHVNRSSEEDAQERVIAKQRIDTAQGIRDSILDDSRNEFDASAKLVANQWMVASRQLEQISNESNVPAFREQALRLSIAARDQARGILEQNVNAQIQQRAASMRTRWEAMTQQELEALQKAGVLPVEAAERLAKLQKAQREAQGTGDERLVQTGEQTPSGVVRDAKLYNQLSPGDRAKLSAATQNAGDLVGTIEALEKVRRDHPAKVGVPGTDAYKQAQALGDELKLQIKAGRELGTLDKGSVEFLEGMTGDPTAWLVNTPDAKIAVIKKRTRAGLRSRKEAAGLDVSDLPTDAQAVDDAAARFGAKPRSAPAPEGPAVASGERPGMRY